IEFFTKGLIDKTLPRHAVQTPKRRRDHAQAVMGLTLRARARMPCMSGRLVNDFQHSRRESFVQRAFHARGSRKMLFVVCQFLVRLTLGAHTRRSCPAHSSIARNTSTSASRSPARRRWGAPPTNGRAIM